MIKSINTIDLKTAAGHIKQVCDDSREANERLPFFFLVGAGISHPPIPLAAEIEKNCMAVAHKYGREREPVDKRPIDTYSHWFEQAHPQPAQRQKYLRKLIEGKFISHANFRLAHLLLDQTIANLVVTPNFDDFLSRALTLFGKPHIVCDHPKTVERIDAERDDLQIVHVHGTYWFYDCCNLNGEIEERAQDSAVAAFTMASLLKEILSYRSPLVIGYSGWEGDVIMTALKRRMQSRLPYNLYWFCYRRNTVEALPDWLKFHPDIYFVLPPVESSPKAISKKSGEERRGQDQKTLRLEAEFKGFLDKESREPALSSREVLDELIRTFELKAPQLTKEPLEFFAEHLRLALPHEDIEKSERDTYLINSVIARIDRANKREKETVQKIETQLEKVRDALRRSQYRETIQQAGDISIHDLSENQRREFLNTIWNAVDELDDNSVDELRGYELVMALGDSLSRQKIDENTQIIITKSFVRRGYVLETLNRNEEAITVYDELVKHFEEASEAAVREQVAWAMVNKSFALGTLNRNEEAIAAYDEVVKRFGENSEEVMREQVAWALLFKGITLKTLNRNEDEIAVYDEVVKRFGEAGETAVREPVAEALVNKGGTLGTLHRSEEAIAVYDEVVKRFGEDSEVAVREQVAKALVNKGITLGTLNRSEEAIAVYDEVVKRFGEASEAAVREQVAKALVNKGVTLTTLNRNEEAIAVYDEVVKRFGEANEAVARESVAKALVNKGITLGTLNRSEEAIAVYDEVVKCFGEASEAAVREPVAIALVNKGGTLGKLNRSEEAIAVYDEVVKRFRKANEAVVREQIASALVNKGVTLTTLNRNEEAIAVYDEVMKRFGEASEAALRELVASALVNKGVTLGTLNRSEDEIAVYDEVVKRFGEDSEAAMREQVATALVKKGFRLGTLNRNEEEIAVYDEVVKRFGEDSEVTVREQVANALNSIGFQMLCAAKLAWANGEELKAKAHLLNAQEKIVAALERMPEDPVKLGNQGYIAFLLGNKDKAREILTRAIAMGGEEIRQGELQDADIHPLAQDEEFKDLVRSIPAPPAKES